MNTLEECCGYFVVFGVDEDGVSKFVVGQKEKQRRTKKELGSAYIFFTFPLFRLSLYGGDFVILS